MKYKRDPSIKECEWGTYPAFATELAWWFSEIPTRIKTQHNKSLHTKIDNKISSKVVIKYHRPKKN